MKMIRNINIYTEPRTKKNHGQIIQCKGRPMVIPSKQYREYEKAVEPFIPKDIEMIDYPINLRCVYYMKTKRKCDLNNLLEATTDMLVKYKVIEDDNYTIVVGHDGSRVFVDKENPRTEIFIEKYEDGD